MGDNNPPCIILFFAPSGGVCMLDYMSSRSEDFRDQINPAMFKRSFDKPLHMYAVEICSNLNVIPGLELISWELITDQSKIDIKLNKKIFKDKSVLKNTSIDKLYSIHKTETDLLMLTFRVNASGYDHTITRQMLIPHQDENGYYTLNGKKTLPIIQIVDSSTYTHKSVLNMKALIMGIKLDKEVVKLNTSEGLLKDKCFKIDLFSKIINPLLYFVAEFGLIETIEYFGLEGIMAITQEKNDVKKFLYAETKMSNVFVEIDKRYLSNKFISSFFTTYVGLFTEDVKIGTLFSTDYWLERLSENFTKRTADTNVLISFKRFMDKGTLSRLTTIDKFDRKNTFTILRFCMRNYDDLMKKDNHDLENRRLRVNESIASHFEKTLTKNINSLLGSNFNIDRINKLLNAIHEKAFLRAIGSHDLFRRERFNDFDAINLARYSFKGPAGINGNKNTIAAVHRNIYPSHAGRIDFNVCSANAPGLTGYLTCNVKLFGANFSDKMEPQSYSHDIKKLKTKHESYNKNLAKVRKDRLLMEQYLNSKTGKYEIEIVKTSEEKRAEMMAKDSYFLDKDGRVLLFEKSRFDSEGRLIIPIDEDVIEARTKYRVNSKGQVIIEFRPGADLTMFKRVKRRKRRNL